MGTPLVLTQQIDSATWQALGLLLTVAGLMVSVVVWRRAGTGHGLRAVAWSLVPLAAGLTGLLRLTWDILDSVLQWAVRLVFSPVVWLGLVVAAVAVVLHVAGGVLIRRSTRTDGSGEPAALPGGATTAIPAAPSATPAGKKARSGKGATPRRTGKQQQDSLIDDQDDIEAILRKHGIS